VDIQLGPEMRSTGEVMGIDKTFGRAFMKSQLAAGQRLPLSGTVFISVRNQDKEAITSAAMIFEELGFKIIATRGTAEYLSSHGVRAQVVNKVFEGRPNVVDHIKNREVQLIINTPSGKRTKRDSLSLRQATLLYGIPYTTTVAGAKAMAQAIKELTSSGLDVTCLQEHYSGAVASEAG
jgi:carbamoyl-phosphate synthase large subunit